MNTINIQLREDKHLPFDQLIDLYLANEWSSAKKPVQLYLGLTNSHCLITAWSGDRMIGLGNAIADGHLVVYYPHLIVHPEFQGKGVGSLIVKKLQEKYRGYHQQMLTADGRAIEFYKKHGFERAGNTEPMWVYEGKDH